MTYGLSFRLMLQQASDLACKANEECVLDLFALVLFNIRGFHFVDHDLHTTAGCNAWRRSERTELERTYM